jgi:hypothetical protein
LQAQVERTKGELKGEFHGKRITATIKEISPSGVRMEHNQEGEIKEGKFDARFMQTTSFLLKSDGIMEWETKGIASTKEGDTVAYWGNGTARPTGENNTTMEGEIHRMTTSSRFSTLNNTTVWVEAKGNMSTGEYSGKEYTK